MLSTKYQGSGGEGNDPDRNKHATPVGKSGKKKEKKRWIRYGTGADDAPEHGQSGSNKETPKREAVEGDALSRQNNQATSRHASEDKSPRREGSRGRGTSGRAAMLYSSPSPTLPEESSSSPKPEKSKSVLKQQKHAQRTLSGSAKPFQPLSSNYASHSTSKQGPQGTSSQGHQPALPATATSSHPSTTATSIEQSVPPRHQRGSGFAEPLSSAQMQIGVPEPDLGQQSVPLHTITENQGKLLILKLDQGCDDLAEIPRSISRFEPGVKEVQTHTTAENQGKLLILEVDQGRDDLAEIPRSISRFKAGVKEIQTGPNNGKDANENNVADMEQATQEERQQELHKSTERQWSVGFGTNPSMVLNGYQQQLPSSLNGTLSTPEGRYAELLRQLDIQSSMVFVEQPWISVTALHPKCIDHINKLYERIEFQHFRDAYEPPSGLVIHAQDPHHCRIGQIPMAAFIGPYVQFLRSRGDVPLIYVAAIRRDPKLYPTIQSWRDSTGARGLVRALCAQLLVAYQGCLELDFVHIRSLHEVKSGGLQALCDIFKRIVGNVAACVLQNRLPKKLHSVVVDDLHILENDKEFFDVVRFLRSLCNDGQSGGLGLYFQFRYVLVHPRNSLLRNMPSTNERGMWLWP